jgi:hypothetical protein
MHAPVDLDLKRSLNSERVRVTEDARAATTRRGRRRRRARGALRGGVGVSGARGGVGESRGHHWLKVHGIHVVSKGLQSCRLEVEGGWRQPARSQRG